MNLKETCKCWPRLNYKNKGLAAALTSFVIKRDEYQALLQTQVRACLNAFGLGILLLLKLEILQTTNGSKTWL